MFFRIFPDKRCPLGYGSRVRACSALCKITLGDLTPLNNLRCRIHWNHISLAVICWISWSTEESRRTEKLGCTYRNQIHIRESGNHKRDQPTLPSCLTAGTVLVLVPHLIEDCQSVQLCILSLHINGFASFTKGKSLDEVSCLLLTVHWECSKAYGGTSRHDTFFPYITFALLLNILQEAIKAILFITLAWTEVYWKVFKCQRTMEHFWQCL